LRDASIAPVFRMMSTSTWCWTISESGWHETDEERTDRETVITDLLEGQYKDPIRVVAFNTAERWSRDV
jgi:hypothetical protein